MPDADDGSASRDERLPESDDEPEPAAAADAAQSGVSEGAGPDALEADDDGLIPEDVELAAGTIPTSLFETVEEPREAPLPPATARPGRPTARRRSQRTDLAGALLGSDPSAGEVPDALRDTVAAIEELFPGTLLASAPREEADSEADSEADPDPDAGTDEAAAAAIGAPRPGEDPRAEAGAGLFDGDGAQAPRDDSSQAGQRTTSDRSEAG